MSRYLLTIEVVGNAPAQLDKIAQGISKVAQEAGAMASGLEKANGGIEDVDKKLGAGLFSTFSDKISQVNAKFSAMVSNMKAEAHDFIKGIVDDAALFEDSQAEMRFAFGADWESVYSQVKKDAADLTFTFDQVSKLASSMGRMHINPFGGASEEAQKFESRTGGTVRALAILQDTADSVGKSADDVIVSVRNALSGSWKSLQDRFDIPKDKITEWKKKIEGLKEPQEKYNALVAELGKMYGGAGQEKAANWNKNIAQIPDLLQQIRAEAGMPGLKIMTKAVQEFVSALTGLVQNKAAMKALTDGFTTLATVIAWGIQQGAKFVTWITKILEFAPYLPKVAAGVGLVTLAFVTLASVLTGIMVTIVAIVSAILAVGWEVILGVAAGLVAMAPLLAALAVVAVGIGVALKASGDMISEGWGGADGPISLFEKAKILFEAVSEAISTFNGETSEISLGTAEKLKKAGLWDTFVKIEKVIYNVNQAWDAFNVEMDRAAEVIGPVIIPLFYEVKDLMYELGDALGITTTAQNASEASTDSWVAAGEGMADILIDLGKFTVQLIRAFVLFSRVAIVVGGVIWSVVKVYLTPFYLMFKAIELVVKSVAEQLSKYGSLAKALHLDKLLGSDDEKKKTGPLWRSEVAVTRPKFAALGGKGQGFGGFGSNYKDLGGEEKDSFIQRLMLDGSLSQKNAERLGKGLAPIEEAPRGVDLDQYIAAPRTLTPTRPGSILNTQGGTGTSSAAAGVSPEVGRAIAQAIAQELAKQPRPPINVSVQMDKKEVAKAVYDNRTGTSGVR